MFFDEELFGDHVSVKSSSSATSEDAGAGAEAASVRDDPVGGSASASNGSSSAGRRKRGSRGGRAVTAARDKATSEKRWRSGAVPAAPTFSGDVETDPFCLRHYRRRLHRWVAITKEYLPPSEQALRALEQLRGDAEVELEEIDDSRYNCAEGIKLLLEDLEVSFGEKELFRQGGVIREFEGVTRLQGESVTAFVRRFRLLERKLLENKIPSYPEQARVIKLLDGLRLGEKSTSSLLLAAGNRYEMDRIQDAIKIQCPAGMSVTGLPRGRPDFRKRAASTPSTATSSSRSSTSSRPTRSSRPSRRWSQSNADWYNENDGEDNGEEDLDDIPEGNETFEGNEDEHNDDDQYEEDYDYVDIKDGENRPSRSVSGILRSRTRFLRLPRL